MNLNWVAVWHSSDSNGVVLRVRFLPHNHREPATFQAENKAACAGHLIFWTRATKKMKSSALTRGSPMHTRFPWPRGTKWSGRKNFPSWSRNLFFRGKNLIFLFKIPPLWFEFFRLIPQFWITEELLYVGHGNASLGHNMPCWQSSLGKSCVWELEFRNIPFLSLYVESLRWLQQKLSGSQLHQMSNNFVLLQITYLWWPDRTAVWTCLWGRQ